MQLKPFDMKADQTLQFHLELNFSAKNPIAHDWSVVAWGEKGAVEVKNKNPKLVSDSLPYIERKPPVGKVEDPNARKEEKEPAPADTQP